MVDVLHICYPGVGGQAAVATGLAVEGTRAGSRQAIVFYGVEATARQYLERCDAEGIRHASIVKKPGIGIGARKKLRAAIRAFAPAAIIAHHHDTCITAAVDVFKSRRAAVVFVEHHSNALKSGKDWVLSAIAHRLSDHTVCLTDAYRRTVQDKAGRFHQPGKSSVIPNGLDLPLYAAQEDRQNGRIVIGMQGRMDEGKDFSVLLDAFSSLRQLRPELDLSLELIGDGPHRQALERSAPEDTVFTGFLGHADLVGRMSQWDVAVLATEGETLSMAVLEAWALGIPLVASDVPGVGDLICDGSDGVLFEAKSPVSLRGKIASLLDDPTLAKKVGAAGRARVQRGYDRRTIWLQYEQLIRRLLHPAAHATKQANTDPLP